MSAETPTCPSTKPANDRVSSQITLLHQNKPIPRKPEQIDYTEDTTFTVRDNKNLTIFHQNIQSLTEKVLELEVFLGDLLPKPDILCLTEHWLKESEIVSAHINGYCLASSWCRTQMLHGGSCIYVREGLDCRDLIPIRHLSVEGHVEFSAIELAERNSIVLCVYRPSTSDQLDIFYSRFMELMEALGNKLLKKCLIICGDFNIDLLKKNKMTTDFLDVLTTFNLKHTIHKPTRITTHSRTLLDNIIMNRRDSELEGDVIENALSDHSAQVLTLPQAGSTNNYAPHQFRNYSQAKLKEFQCELSHQDWTTVMNTMDVDEAYNRFSTILIDLSNVVFSFRTAKKPRGHVKWITKGIKISCTRKRQMFILLREGQINIQEYRTYCRILKRVIRKAKQLSSESFIHNSRNKSRATWQLVKSITDNNDCRRPNLKEAFEAESLQQLLDGFNRHFTDAALNSNLSPNANPTKVTGTNLNLFLEPTDNEEIIGIIQSLKTTNAVGHDQIPVKLLKYVRYQIADPLRHIINLSMTCGVFPSELRIATVHPIFKKGEKSEFGNYRPISILPSISKILEKVYYVRMIKFIESKNLLNSNQNGFRKNKSTVRAMYQLINDVCDSLNNKRATAAVFMDLSKAFDTIDHSILLEKVKYYGLRGIPNDLICSYLSKRRQYVVDYDNETGKLVKSEQLTMERGVPQGSILGPLLFILYINDLPNVTTESMVLYADDTTMIFSEPSTGNLARKIEEKIPVMNAWFTENCMALNMKKTEIVKFSYPMIDNNPLQINTDGGALESVDEARFLGIQIDRRLDWRPQINKLAQKIASCAYALKIIARNISPTAAKTAYYAYVQSILRYGIIVWANSVESNRVFILQKRCIRGVFGMRWLESCRPVFIREGILTLYSIYIIEAVKFITENKTLFSDSVRHHDYSTRCRGHLCPKRPNFTYIMNNANYSLIKIYNKIPSYLKNMEPPRVYKILKDHFVSRAYYGLDEFFEDDLEAAFSEHRPVEALHCEIPYLPS